MSMQTSIGEENLPRLGKAKRILIIEDEPTIADYLSIYCRAEGYEVSYERDGLEGLACFQAEQPDFVLLDLKLPKISGLEVLRCIREDERTRLLPVIVLSSSDEEKDILRTYELGVNSYILKPTDFSEFTEAARQVGVYWLTLNQVPRNKSA